MNLLKTQDGDVPTTRNSLVNYLHLQLTCIAVQVYYTAIRNNLILHNHTYFIYCLQLSLNILKSGYPASNIMINSSLSSRALIIFITPFSSKSLISYGKPNKTSESSVGIMRHTKNGYIDTFLLFTMARGSATNTTQTHLYVPPG